MTLPDRSRPLPESAEQITRNERLIRTEVMIIGVTDDIKEMRQQLTEVVEYVNTRKGAFRVAERIGTFIMMLCAASVATLITWLRSK